MNLIDATLIVIKEIIKTVFKILTPIFIVIFILVVIKIIYRYKKYGKAEFDVFKKHEKTKFSDIIINIIKKIDNNAQCIEKENLYSDIVLVNNTGIYLLKIIKYKGLVNGKRSEKILKNKVKRNIEIEVENPFYYLEKDKNKILNIDNNLTINTILITSNTVNININNVNKNEIISLQSFYYTMENYLKKQSIYDDTCINKIIKKIRDI